MVRVLWPRPMERRADGELRCLAGWHPSVSAGRVRHPPERAYDESRFTGTHSIRHDRTF